MYKKGMRRAAALLAVCWLGLLFRAAAETPALIMAEVSAERVRQVRAQLPVLSNRRFAPPQLL